MSPEDIANRFQYHAPDEQRAQRHATVRKYIGDLAGLLNMDLPEGREKSLVMTHLEEAMFWANAAIARQS